MVIAILIGLCVGVVKKILKVTAVVILCLVILSLIPNLPPYIEYNAYNVTPPVPLKGALSINTLLNNAEHLYEGALKGPEAFDVYNGVLYTGLHGGEIVKLVDGNVIPVAKFGKPCEGFWEEKKCGRPLGIKFGRDGFLYVADAYYGVFKVNVNDGTKIQLISANDSIGGKPIKLPNGVDVTEDGIIYWTISSSEFNLEDGIFDMLADGSGRLLRYDPKTKTNEVLIDNLHFANGVVLSSNEEFVLVAETARSRIHRYYLKGPKKGMHDIFLDGLPGMPDNLKSDGSNGFFMPLVVGRDSSNPNIFQSIGPFPSIRRAFSRLLALLELFFWQVDSMYPNYYAKRAIHFIGHFESMHGIGPTRFTVLHVNENGQIKSSYHCTDGKLTGISEIHWFNGAFYLGSPYNTYVGRVVLDIPEVHNSKNLPVKEAPILKKQAQDQGQPKKRVEQQQEKRPPTEQTPPEPTIKQKHSAQDKQTSETDQQKQSITQEKVPVKQQKHEKEEQNKPVQEPKHSEKPTEQPKMQKQLHEKDEKPSVQQQKTPLKQSKETVNERKQSAGQQKPQSAAQQQKQKPAEVTKPPAQHQKQKSAEIPKPPVQQQKSTEVPKTPAQQQKQKSAEVPKPPAQQQTQKSAEIPKPPVQQQKSAEVPKPAQKQKQKSAEVPKPPAQQQKQKSAEVPKPPAQQQKQQSAEVPKPPAQQQQKQKSAEVPKPPAQQQKQKSAEVPKPPAQQQKQKSAEIPKPPAQQQKQKSAEVPKSPAQQQKQKSAEVPKSPAQQQKQKSAEVPKPPAQQQKPVVTDKLEPKQANEQKTVPHHAKPQGQDQKKMEQHKAANQQDAARVQKASTKEQQPPK